MCGFLAQPIVKGHRESVSFFSGTGLLGFLVDKGSDASDRFVVLEDRLLSFIERVLANPRSKDVQLPTGYSAVSEELGGLVGSFLRIVSYNQAVFGSYYSEILSSTLAGPATSVSS